LTTSEVSVIMTVYNGEKYLEQAIKSICQQSLVDFEFVIVDDGSNDQTPGVLTQEAKKDPRIKVVTTSRIGRAKALNLAWNSANGVYIANIDADDLAEPTRLESQLEFLRQHPEIGLLGSAWNTFNEKTKSVYSKHPPISNKELRKALIHHMPFCHSSIMMPRYALENVGGYDENLIVAIDADICVRIAHKYQIANLPLILVTKRYHPSSHFSDINCWIRYRTAVSSRWQAWNNFSGSLLELFSVINPIGILDICLKKQIRTIISHFVNIKSTSQY
jgi:glycosyltransferase involved in cell wall biosynthesis